MQFLNFGERGVIGKVEQQILFRSHICWHELKQFSEDLFDILLLNVFRKLIKFSVACTNSHPLLDFCPLNFILAFWRKLCHFRWIFTGADDQSFPFIWKPPVSLPLKKYHEEKMPRCE